MSPNAARIAPLRQQLAQLDYWLDHWPVALKHSRARKRQTQRNRDQVAAILRGLAGLLIAGVSS